MTDERWRKGFEMTGPETLLLQLSRNEFSGEYRQEAIKWVLEKGAKAAAIDRKRFQIIRRWTIIGGVAAVVVAIAGLIAAWPVIKEWI